MATKKLMEKTATKTNLIERQFILQKDYTMEVNNTLKVLSWNILCNKFGHAFKKP